MKRIVIQLSDSEYDSIRQQYNEDPKKVLTILAKAIAHKKLYLDLSLLNNIYFEKKLEGLLKKYLSSIIQTQATQQGVQQQNTETSQTKKQNIKNGNNNNVKLAEFEVLGYLISLEEVNGKSVVIIQKDTKRIALGEFYKIVIDEQNNIYDYVFKLYLKNIGKIAQLLQDGAHDIIEFMKSIDFIALSKYVRTARDLVHYKENSVLFKKYCELLNNHLVLYMMKYKEPLSVTFVKSLLLLATNKDDISDEELLTLLPDIEIYKGFVILSPAHTEHKELKEKVEKMGGFMTADTYPK